jgi:hypothetical protein
MSWTLWARTGKPAPPAPSRPPEPRVTVNRVHGYVSFNQAALSLMGLTESRVELLYDQDTGLLGFRREEAGQGYAMTRDRQVAAPKLLKQVDARSGKYEPALVDAVWAIPCLAPPKGQQE